LRKGQKYPDAYYPGSEELEPDEMRVTALGTGMPNAQPVANEDGVLWFIAGTDSGFEGLTKVYYDAITVVLEQRE